MEKILYLITDNTLESEILIERTTAAISAGIDMLQFRGKKVSEAQLNTNLMDPKTAALVMALKKLCHEESIPLIINDDPYLAKAVGADGVHLGQEDMGPNEARAILGPKSIIGVTAKTTYQAVKAASEGANYLGVGAIYPSKTKKNALGITIETLKAIKASETIPVYGIGGLHPDNLTSEILENTDGLCFVSAVYRAENVRETIQEIRDVMKR